MYLRLLFVPTFEAASINTKVLPVDCWSTVQRSGWKDEQSCCCWSIQPVNSHVKPSFGYPRIIHLLDHPKNHENLAMMPWFNAQSHGVMAFLRSRGYGAHLWPAISAANKSPSAGPVSVSRRASRSKRRRPASLDRKLRWAGILDICIYVYIYYDYNCI